MQLSHQPLIVFRKLPDGGFVAGDSISRRTAYAYPSSEHANIARTMPERVAAAMVASALRDPSPARIRADYDARNWQKIDNA